MLRSIHRSGRRFVPLFSNNTASLRRDASTLSPAAPPSITTTVLLRNLAPTVTETTLKASIGAIKELQIRKIEIEPGCAFHFTNEAEASFATKILHLHHQKTCTTQIINSTMPSLLLQNLPATMYEQHLEKCFSKFNPKIVRLTGLPMMQVIVNSADDAIHASHIIEQSQFGGITEKLRTHIVKLPGDEQKFAIQFNVLMEMEAMKGLETELKEKLASISRGGDMSITMDHGAPQSATLRFPSSTMESQQEVMAGLQKVTINGKKLKISPPAMLKKPALFIRNVRKLGVSKLQHLMAETSNADPDVRDGMRLQINKQSTDVYSDLAVAYYPSEKAALQALTVLRVSKIDGTKVAVSYREVAEPAIKVHNLPIKFSDADVADMFALYSPVRIEILDTPISSTSDSKSSATSSSITTEISSGRSALIVLGGPKDVQLAIATMDKKTMTNSANGQSYRLAVTNAALQDMGIDVAMADGSMIPSDSLHAALQSVGLQPKGINLNTNISAFVGFMTVGEAINAQNSFLDGITTLDLTPGGSSIGGGSMVNSRLSVQPMYVVEVTGLDQNTPVSQLQDQLASGLENRGNSGGGSSGGGNKKQQQQQQQQQKGGQQKKQDKGKKNVETATASAAAPSSSSSSPTNDETQASSSAAQKTDNADVAETPTAAPITDATPPPATPTPSTTPYELRALLSHRSAIVKFKRQSDVVFGMKQLRLNPTQSNDLQGVVVSRYRPVVQDGIHEIDEDGEDEEFDKYGLNTILRDYMYADPATRYQIAQNYFERSLVDAQALESVDILVDPTVTKEVRDEANSLMKLGKKMDTASRQRLFELYIQREELSSFVHDFRELEMYFGAANPSDDFDWSQFRVEEWEDIVKIQANMKLADDKFMQKASTLSGHNDTMGVLENDQDVSSSSTTSSGGKEPMMSSSYERNAKEIVIPDETGLSGGTTVSLEDPTNLKDKDGRLWSGAILDTDMVQKTMPGGRVGTHRALVVVGNLRGAAGFGMGKGKTGGDAVNAAFRDALRNLTYIDIYDRFGLAHDLHGKHNSCHAYIRATPRARVMVASPFATAVLTRFGIGSASVKLIGRRDPYAMVRAMFNALKQHENIDEFAKDRGKRYLTLKWLYENNI